jgi:putative beta-lysine N-acetyltransferase
MNSGVWYYCIRQEKRLAAIASCDIDTGVQNVEMTDFATDPRFQGKGLAGCLLHAMETEMAEEGVRLAYTIARAGSYPINAIFARAGFRFGGTLPNNTNISGTIESMNVWYKRFGDGNRRGAARYPSASACGG